MKWTLGLLFVASVASALPKRDAKAFSLFSVVTFPNEECRTIMTPSMAGICVTAEECTGSGGTASGNCASGFGVCCFRTVEATQTTQTVAVNNDLTHIQNEGYPQMVGDGTAPVTATNLEFQIAGDASICQIKLDFIDTVLSAPATAVTNGETCINDALTVEVAGRTSGFGFSSLCGRLTGQHIYLDTARQNPAAEVTITTGTNSFARSWKILVRRLRCDDPDLSPGCLQYHTGLAGRIVSLNGGYDGQSMLRNLNYEICIRPGANMNGLIIGQSTAAGAAYSIFNLQDDTSSTSAKSMTGNDAGTVRCEVEGIVIPNSLFAALQQAAALPPIFCGGFLNPSANQAAAGNVISFGSTTGSNPFAIGVVSDNGPPSADTGFDLTYQQSA